MNLRSFMASSTALVFAIAIVVMSLMSVADPIRVYPSENIVAKEEYFLPYPGILPDNILYRFKVARDQIQVWMTRSGEDKANLALSLADKRLGAAIALLDGNKGDLAVSTLTKGEKYLQQSVDEVVAMQKQGKDVKSLLLTLTKACAKHIEVEKAMLNKTAGENRIVVEQTLKMTSSLQEKVAQAWRESK